MKHSSAKRVLLGISCSCAGLLPCLYFFFFAVSTLQAQDRPSISLRIRSEAVLVDLVVTGKNGSFVDDLKRDEIQLREDGKPQKVTFFELRRAASDNAGNAEVSGGPVLSENSTDFGAPAQDLALVFLVDLSGIEHGDLVLTKKSIAEFAAKHAGPHTRYMLASNGINLRIDQPFTSNIEEFQAQLNKLEEVGDSDRYRFGAFRGQVENLFRSLALNSSFQYLLEAARTAVSRGTAFLASLENQVSRSTQGISLLASYLRTLPGRKHIVYYSAGYPLQAADEISDIIRNRIESELPGRLSGEQRAQLSPLLNGLQRRNLHRYIEQAVDRLNRGQVSVYAVDVRGLIANSQPASRSHQVGSRSAVLGRNAHLASADISTAQDYLVSLASGSGGMAFFNSNDLQRGIRRAYGDAREYYLLSYHPSTKRKDGKYHRIEIKITRPGVRARYRNGYLDFSDKDERHNEVQNALSFPWLYEAMKLHLEVDAKGGHVKVKTLIPTRSLTFRKEGGTLNCPLETYAVLIDTKGKWVKDKMLFAKRAELKIPREKLAAVRQVDYVSSEAEGSAPPGKYTLVVVVRQGSAANIGSAVQEVQIQK